VTLVEYGDYQCPYCAEAQPIVREVLRLRPDRVRFAFRHFPLTNAHQYAEPAAEAAQVRGRFWPMHDWLLEHQDEVGPAYLRRGAEQVDLPADEVTREVDEHRYLNRVRRDFVSGIRSGVHGTPTFFVNDVRHDGGHSLPDLLAAVDEAG
jgi:protein-disulfide isomerase